MKNKREIDDRTLDELEERINAVSEEFRKDILKNVLYSFNLSEKVFDKFKDIIDADIITNHPFITEEFLSNHKDYFSKEEFLKNSRNVLLILKKKFREEFGITEDECINFIDRMYLIRDEVFLAFNEEENTENIVLKVFEKAEFEDKEKTKEKKEKIINTYKKSILSNLEILSKRKVEISEKEINSLIDITPLSYDNFLKLFNLSVSFPNSLKYLIEKANSSTLYKEDSTKIDYIDKDYILIKLEQNLAVNVLKILFLLNNNSITRDLFFSFLVLRGVNDEQAISLLEIFDNFFTYEEEIKLAKAKNWKQFLIALSLR